MMPIAANIAKRPLFSSRFRHSSSYLESWNSEWIAFAGKNSIQTQCGTASLCFFTATLLQCWMRKPPSRASTNANLTVLVCVPSVHFNVSSVHLSSSLLISHLCSLSYLSIHISPSVHLLCMVSLSDLLGKAKWIAEVPRLQGKEGKERRRKSGPRYNEILRIINLEMQCSASSVRI